MELKEYNQVFQAILKFINADFTTDTTREVSVKPYQDFFNLSRAFIDQAYQEKNNRYLKTAIKSSKDLREIIDRRIRLTEKAPKELYEISKKCLLMEAFHDFDSYMLYLELNRRVEDRFYVPRRKVLKLIVDQLQKLENDELDELFISLPPRVGKTSIVQFFLTWVMGRNSEKSNLYSSYSDTITSTFYTGILEILNDEMTYLWREIFPNSYIAQTNSKSETINIDRVKKYASLTCRSIGGTLNGSTDANGYLVADDLISGIEEAMNPQRLKSAWALVDNNLITRAKEKCKIIWIGTRWSVYDPIGVRARLLVSDPSFKTIRKAMICIPALDENDESNFDYDYNVGFSTTYYLKRRASFEQNGDIASWQAQYQNDPIEREGTLFQQDSLKFFNGELPDKEPDRIILPVDVAFGGGDFVSAPVLYDYEGVIYCPDVVFDPNEKDVTIPRITSLIMKHKVSYIRFEHNNGGEGYAEKVEERLKQQNYKALLTTKYANTTKRKEDRIFENAPDIRGIYFLEPSARNRDYNLFMANLMSYTLYGGRHKHDDAPDSLAMGIEMLNERKSGYVVFERPF